MIKKEKGFTLVEVIVAMGIFGMVMVALMGIYTTALNIQKSSNEITEVNNKLAGLIEEDGGKELTPSVLTISFPDSKGGYIWTTTVNGYYHSQLGDKKQYRIFRPDGWNY